MAQSATTIYLNEEQRKKLFKLAEAHKSSFSSEIRAAIDRYVKEGDAAISDVEMQALAVQANESLDRMANALDDAHAVVKRVLNGRPKKGAK